MFFSNSFKSQSRSRFVKLDHTQLISVSFKEAILVFTRGGLLFLGRSQFVIAQICCRSEMQTEVYSCFFEQ